MAFEIDAGGGADGGETVFELEHASGLHVRVIAFEAEPVLGARLLDLLNVLHLDLPALVPRGDGAGDEVGIVDGEGHLRDAPVVAGQHVDVDLLVVFHDVELIGLGLADHDDRLRVVDDDGRGENARPVAPVDGEAQGVLTVFQPGGVEDLHHVVLHFVAPLVADAGPFGRLQAAAEFQVPGTAARVALDLELAADVAVDQRVGDGGIRVEVADADEFG